MKKYDWKKEYNPIRRTAKRILSYDPLPDGRPLSDGARAVIPSTSSWSSTASPYPKPSNC